MFSVYRSLCILDKEYEGMKQEFFDLWFFGESLVVLYRKYYGGNVFEVWECFLLSKKGIFF